MAKKEFKFYGLTFEEVTALNRDEFIALLPSRERRTVKRGFSDRQKKLLADISAGKKNIKTHDRDMIILPEMVGTTLKVHSGKIFSLLIIEKEMLGHRLGEFALTRKRLSHSNPGVGSTKSGSAVSVR
jgi:small subunit ribosomal protein S19